jgi:probable rRNA maturation factor
MHTPKLNEASLALLAQKILRTLKSENATLDVVLLPHKEMAALKWRLMKKKTEPNVLSFRHPATFPHPETKKKFLGEVFLNKDILAKSPDRAAPLLIHGILHLVGYDHEKKADRAKMEAKENNLLKTSGGKWFARSPLG